MPGPVYCCKDCRTIVEKFLFYSPTLKNGEPNGAQGRCRNCGSTQFREGWMSKQYEIAWLNGRCDPDFVEDATYAVRKNPLAPSKTVVFMPTGTSFVGYEGLK